MTTRTAIALFATGIIGVVAVPSSAAGSPSSGSAATNRSGITAAEVAHQRFDTTVQRAVLRAAGRRAGPDRAIVHIARAAQLGSGSEVVETSAGTCSVNDGGGFAIGVTKPGKPTKPRKPNLSTQPGVSLNHNAFTLLEPAGDLDGDGHTDVIDLRLAGAPHSAALSAGITARSGTTGAPLWSREIDNTGHHIVFPDAEPDLVGPTATPGVIVSNEDLGGGHAATTSVSVALSAITGDGMLVWSRDLSGQLTQHKHGTTLTTVPILIGELNDTDTTGTDLVAESITGTERDKGFSTYSIRPEVISAATGAVTPLGAAITSSSALQPALDVVPDLNGDGVNDLVITDASAGTLTAESGADGTAIWTSSSIPTGVGTALEPIGDVVGGDGDGDLLVSNQDFTNAKGPTATQTLVDGATGNVAWTHVGECGYSIADLGGTSGPGVGLVVSDGEVTANKHNSAFVKIAGRTVSGSLAFSKTVTAVASAKKRVHSGSFSVALDDFGDVQPDGAQDFAIELKARVGSHHAMTSGILSGLDGTVIPQPAGDAAAGSLQSGDGDDNLVFHSTPNGPRLRGYDAATGTQLYARRISTDASLKAVTAFGIRVSGHDCSDISLSSAGTGNELFGLYDGAGDPLWTVSAAGSALRGGTLTTATPPTSFCAPA